MSRGRCRDAFPRQIRVNYSCTAIFRGGKGFDSETRGRHETRAAMWVMCAVLAIVHATRDGERRAWEVVLRRNVRRECVEGWGARGGGNSEAAKMEICDIIRECRESVDDGRTAYHQIVDYTTRGTVARWPMCMKGDVVHRNNSWFRHRCIGHSMAWMPMLPPPHDRHSQSPFLCRTLGYALQRTLHPFDSRLSTTNLWGVGHRDSHSVAVGVYTSQVFLWWEYERRFVLVTVDVIAAFIISFLPPSTTIRRHHRNLLATTSSGVGVIYYHIVSLANMKHEHEIPVVIFSLIAIRSKLMRSADFHINEVTPPVWNGGPSSDIFPVLVSWTVVSGALPEDCRSANASSDASLGG
ncbi:hypothetical protein BDZ97DRAFT_1760651 [Flammula alnicola]|nr:hypothetical protein BDZ97DRAFT_1760651 [Flammula alnicola]